MKRPKTPNPPKKPARPTAEHPSALYLRVLKAGQDFHKKARTWSGGLAVRHAPRIKEMIERTGAKSILDYGCGKGLQYLYDFDGKKLEDYWGVPVFKYDPALTEDWKNGRAKFADVHPPKVSQKLPEGQTWDLLVCTHVLGCVPEEDLNEWVVPLFYRVIKKGMYFAENLAPPTKKVVKNKHDKEDLSREWGAEDWINAVTKADQPRDIEFWFRGHDPDRLGSRFEKWPFDGTILK